MISIIQHLEADFLWIDSLKILNSGIILKTFTHVYSKTCVKRPFSKRPKISFQDQLSLNAGQKYCGAFCNTELSLGF